MIELAQRANRGEDVGRPLSGRSLALIFQRPSNRTQEITDAVLDDPRSAVFEQAEHRPWAQLALLFDGVPTSAATLGTTVP